MTSDPAVRSALERLPRLVLWGWVALALLYGALVVWAASGAEGWASLVAAVGALIVAYALLAIGVSALIARFLVNGRSARTAVALLGPPGFFLLAVFAGRLMN